MKMGRQKSKRFEREVPENKLKAVDELKELIKNSKTFMICSIKGLPGKQFQTIKKWIRNNAKVKVVKKGLIVRAIDDSGIEIKKIKEHIKEDFVLLFSDIDAFELSAMLSENKSPVAAKAGQIASENIEIEPGPTELVPGPVISELGSLGMKIAIEDGKINIKEKKTIVKSGEVISETAASLMAKLDMKPFLVGYEPIAAYNSGEHKIYTKIKINKEKTLEELKHAFSKALAFAVNIAYPCHENIRHLIVKAVSHEKALSSKINLHSAHTADETKS